MISGQCLCGAVQYAVTAPFEYSVFCHCSRCRRASGSAFVSSAGVRKDKVRIDRGAESITTHARGPDATSHFCKVCGSILFLVVRQGEYAHVQMGTLTDDPGIRPIMHVQVASKAPWYSITDTLPQFPEMPPRRSSP